MDSRRRTAWRVGWLIATIAGGSAWADEPDPYSAPSGPIFQAPQPSKFIEPKFECGLEAITGTHIMRRVCRSPERIAAERAGALQFIRSMDRFTGRSFGVRSDGRR